MPGECNTRAHKEATQVFSGPREVVKVALVHLITPRECWVTYVIWGVGVSERERERERERETDRQTDRETETERERHRDRQSDRERQTETEKEREKGTWFLTPGKP